MASFFEKIDSNLSNEASSRVCKIVENYFNCARLYISWKRGNKVIEGKQNRLLFTLSYSSNVLSRLPSLLP